MDKQATIRRVRISVSVFFGVLALAMCVLWLRSYWWVDVVYFSLPTGHDVQVTSSPGAIGLFIGLRPASSTMPHWQVLHIRPEDVMSPSNVFPMFDFEAAKGDLSIGFPHWFAASIAGLFAIAASIYKLRFSLGTMLIATTLVAIVLGLGVWLVR